VLSDIVGGRRRTLKPKWEEALAKEFGVTIRELYTENVIW